MTIQEQNLIKRAYDAFNQRDINSALELMHQDVHWPNGWEGGHVNGHDEVKEYWIRQWKVINPCVFPVSIKERNDGRIEVEVHQAVKDLNDKIISDGVVKHVYTFENGKIKSMQIEKS